jgi:hypothetical protein
MRNNPVNGKKKKKRKVIKGIRMDVPSNGRATTQERPVIPRQYDPKIYEKYTTPQGFTKWRKRKTGAKALPLSKSVKKGSPRSYENLRKAKPLSKKRKNGID